MKLVPIFALFAVAATAQPPAPPKQAARQPYTPTPEELRQIQTKADELGGLIGAAKAKHPDTALVADVAVYEKAARWILRFPEEFFSQDYVAQTLSVLDQGS